MKPPIPGAASTPTYCTQSDHVYEHIASTVIMFMNIDNGCPLFGISTIQSFNITYIFYQKIFLYTINILFTQ